MASGISVRIGMRVEVIGKNLTGTVSYVGMTAFAAGKWVGVALDESKGKNDGTVQGKKYFECPQNHGIFVRQTQLQELTEDVKVERAVVSPRSSGLIPPTSGLSKIAGLRKPGFSLEPVQSPVKSGIKAPSGIAKPMSSSPSQREKSPPTSGIQKPGSPSPSLIGRTSGAVSPSSGIGKPGQSIPRPGSADGIKTPQKLQGGLPKPQAGIEKQAKSDSPAIKKPMSGLKGPSTPSGLQKPSSSLSAANQTPKVPTSPEEIKPQKTTPVEQPSPLTPSIMSEEPKAKLEPQRSSEQLPPAHKVVAASEEVSELRRKLLEREKGVVDLEEKLNVLKQKRQADLIKLKEVDKLRIQNQQFLEYKTKWQESQRELQNQLRQAQNEAREAADKMSSEGDISELQEAVEMATLDKEMAEEKYESLVQEHEQLKDKHEEISLELEILKNEISEGGVETVVASEQTKQIEHQNMRLKDALVKLKDIAQNDKMELAQAQRVNKEINQQLSTLGAERDKLQDRLQEAESQIDELKEQVDFALGAEEMVEKLTDKNLELEEKIEAQIETIQDLEALRELNEELEENHVQTEHDLREELDLADNRIRECERQITAQIQQANDYQETIAKFRQLVQNLQNRIKELQDVSSDSITTEVLDTTPVPEIDFKTKFVETKQYGRIIELELNKYHVKEANKRIQMINAFLPDHFTKRGADFDGICLLLLLERLKFKCELLCNQLHDKYDIQELVEGGQPLVGLEADQISYACLLSYHLSNFHTVVCQYFRALNECDLGCFMRNAGQYPELAVHEKILDNYIVLLSKDMLDDTVSIEVLEKTISQYQNFYRLNLSDARRDCREFLADSLILFNNGAEAVSIDVQRMKGMAQNCDEGSAFLDLLNFMELKNMEIKQLHRKIKRGMIQDSKTTLFYPDTVTNDIFAAMKEQSMIVQYGQDLASVLSLKHSQLSEAETLLSGHLDESSQDCITLVFERDDDAKQVLSESYNKVLSCLSGIAIKLPEGEYDTEPEEKATPPYLQRAAAFKEELSSTTRLENKIDQKNHDISELKKNIKIKVDELSEANIRIGLLDKRADNAAKEAGIKVEQITKKYEGLQAEFRDKTKQNEKTMDALQSDIDALETENADMKKKLEIYSKKSNVDFSRLSQTSAAMAGIVSAGKPGSAMASLAKAGVAGTSPVQVVLQDSPIFLAQLDAQKKALRHLQNENWVLKAAKMKADLAQLPKPYTPKILWRDGKFVPNVRDTGGEKKVVPQEVLKECNGLYKNLTELSVFPKLVDITKGKTADGKFKPSPEEQFAQQLNLLIKLDKKKEELSKKVQTVIAQELPGASVESSLRNFLSPEYTRLRQEATAPVHVATLEIPVSNAKMKPGVRNVTINPLEFLKIHDVMANS